MRALIAAGLGLLALPGIAAADPATQAALNHAIAPQTTTVMPPPGHPQAFTPAPVPGISGPVIDSSRRAGSAEDAGPINATPMASDQSQGLGTSTAAPPSRQVDPTGNAVPPPQ